MAWLKSALFWFTYAIFIPIKLSLRVPVKKFAGHAFGMAERGASIESVSVDPPPCDVQYRITVAQTLKDVPKYSWDALLPEDASPFMQYEWLSMLEASECASTTTGWQPLHLLLHINGSSVEERPSEQLVMALPLYVKYHSQGEFIFDHAWQEFAETALGIQYYPKVPFSTETSD